MRARPDRAQWRAAVVFAAVVVLIAAVAALGGFRTAPATGGRRLDSGSDVRLQRWVFRVHRVQLADTASYGSRQHTTLRVWLTATWTGPSTVYGPTTGLIGLQVPGGPPVDPSATDVQADWHEGGFDPQVPRPLTLDFTWPAERSVAGRPHQPAVPGVPATAEVVFADEYPKPSFLDPDSWAQTGPIGYLAYPVEDVRR